jgi:sugar phosphate permease
MRFKLDRRLFILVLIFTGYLFCYIDRMVMSTTIPYIGQEFSLSKTAMGLIMSAFFVGYTAFQIPGGIFVDRYGPRKTMSFAIGIWTICTGFTGLVSNLTQMLVTRVIFGIGEASYPAASMKSIALWFEPSRRATATSVILSSNALGPALAPLLAVVIMAHWGWRGTFYALVVPGVILAVLIATFVTEKPLGAKDVAQADGGPAKSSDDTPYTFWQVLKEPAVWKSTIMFFFYNIAGWGFKTWLPTYLVSARHMDMQTMGMVASLPFFAGIGGYLFGGWLTDGLFKNHRTMPVLIFQVATALFLYLTYTVESMGLLVAYQTLAGFFLTAALATVWALPVSSVPKEITGRAIGIFNTGGQLAGLVAPTLIGYLVDLSHGNFNTSFIVMIACIAVSSLITLTIKPQACEE